MIRPYFSSLKRNYSSNRPTHECNMHFPNKCAIRMSEALVKTNSHFLRYFKQSMKNKCPHGYIRGAQDLASILAKSIVFGVRDLGWNSQGSRHNIPSNAKGKKGIICYMNIPSFSGQGHIDLWAGFTEPSGQYYWNLETIWLWTLP